MLHALFIGVDRHVDPDVADLRCARADAEVLASLLGEHLETERQLTVLVDERATKARVRRVLSEELPSRVTREDVFLLFFAGYGAAEIDLLTGDLSSHIVLHDTYAGELRQTSINIGVELAAWLHRLNACSVALIFDASFNGAPGGRSLEGPGLRSGPRQRPERFSLLRLAFSDKCTIFSAAADHEVAAEDSQLGHGVFTQHLLEALHRRSRIHATSSLATLRSEVLVRMNGAGITTQHPVLYGSQTHRPVFQLRERAPALRPSS